MIWKPVINKTIPFSIFYTIDLQWFYFRDNFMREKKEEDSIVYNIKKLVYRKFLLKIILDLYPCKFLTTIEKQKKTDIKENLFRNIFDASFIY